MTPEVGDRVWFRDRTWVVRAVCLRPLPSGDQPGSGPPYVQLADLADERHRLTLLDNGWHLLQRAQ